MKTSNFPTKNAWQTAIKTTDCLLDKFVSEQGTLPGRAAIILWGSEIERTDGIGIAQMLYMMHLKPVWSSEGAIRDLRMISSDETKHPAVDIYAFISGSLRDKFPEVISLVFEALRLKTERHPTGNNLIPVENSNRHSRIFGPAYGKFGTGLFREYTEWFYADKQKISEIFITNMRYAYSPAPVKITQSEFRDHLTSIDCIIQPFTTPGHGPLTLDHIFEFSTGLKSCTYHQNTALPALYLIDMREKNLIVQTMQEALALNLRELTSSEGLFAKISREDSNGLKKARKILALIRAWSNALPTGTSAKQIRLLRQYIQNHPVLETELMNDFRELFSQ